MPMRKFFVAVSLASTLLVAGGYGTVLAGSFLDQFAELLKVHERIKASEAVVQASRERVSISRKEWFPLLSISGNKAKEDRNNVKGTPNTRLNSHEIGLTVTQPVYDFGVRNTSTTIAQSDVIRSELALEQVKQGLLLEAISAHVNLSLNALIDRYARQSVENIKKQANIESARVAKGAGLSTDVLQSKVQLAGAKARYIRSNGTLKQAANRYQAVFNKIPFNFADLEEISIPLVELDKDLDELVKITLDNNIQLAVLDASRQIDKREISLQKSSAWGPKIDIVAERKYKRNVGGTRGAAEETLVKLQLTYDLNLGFSSVNSVNAARLEYVSSDNLFYDARRLIVEAIKTAHSQFNTAKENFRLLEEQAALSSEFLVLARKERKLGKRSLIDVLAGETAEINARSDAAAAQGQVIIAAYSILNLMGILDPKNVVAKNSSSR